MSQAEEDFMIAKMNMTNAISVFYKAAQAIDIDDEGFVDDIAEQVYVATEDESKGEGIVLSDYI